MSLRGTWCTYSIISPCSNKTDKRWSQYPAAERKRAKAHFSGSTGDVKRREIPAQKQRNKQRDKKTKTELWRGTSLISRGKRRYTQGKKNWIKRAPAQTKEERRRKKNKSEKRKSDTKATTNEGANSAFSSRWQHSGLCLWKRRNKCHRFRRLSVSCRARWGIPRRIFCSATLRFIIAPRAPSLFYLDKTYERWNQSNNTACVWWALSPEWESSANSFTQSLQDVLDPQTTRQKVCKDSVFGVFSRWCLAEKHNVTQVGPPSWRSPNPQTSCAPVGKIYRPFPFFAGASSTLNEDRTFGSGDWKPN